MLVCIITLTSLYRMITLVLDLTLMNVVYLGHQEHHFPRRAWEALLQRYMYFHIGTYALDII